MKKLYSLIFAALFAASASAQDVKYVKVTEEPADWCGEYLIVYEADDDNNIAYVFNGALDELDAKGNFFEASNPKENVDGVEARTINSAANVDAATFTVTKSTETDGKYYIQSKSGYWIGYNSTTPDPSSGEIEPNLKASNEKQYDNAISLADGSSSVAVTAKNGFELRFNNDSGKQRFRYHASGKKKAIKFYKKTLPASITTVTADEISTVRHDIVGREVKSLKSGMLYIQNNKRFIAK